MGKIKIYEIAKKFNLTSKEVLDIAQELNIDVKSHLSGVDEDEAKKIEEKLNGKKSKKQETSNKQKAEAKKEEKAPVIIRREVIISEEDEQARKKEMEKKQTKKNNIGFVERKQNKDYNIVYRNKPTKPMTVSELFGLNKEEPKKEEEIKKEVKEEKIEEKKIVKEEQKKEELKKEEKENNTKEEKQEKEVNVNNKKKQNNNRDNRQQNRNNNQNGNFRKNDRNDNRFNNRNNRNNNVNRFGKKPLDAKGIEKNIKNIMETGEKEQVREYNRGIDKQKNNNRFEENNKNKKNKSRRSNNVKDFDEGKLKSLKQTNRLSNMFDDQDGGMLDYYDLTTERGRRGKKRKNQNNEERTKQKIFKLTEIEIPESITVKDFAAEMKKTTADVIKKLLGYGIMATINQEIDFDTAYLIAQEFGITAKKKEVVTDEDILFDESEDKEEELVTRSNSCYGTRRPW